MENLERLLLELSDPSGGIDPGNTVDNIEALVLSDASVTDKELSINLILKSENPPSLVHFVNTFIRTKDKTISKAKITALKFIYRYIKLVGGSHFEHFALSTFNTLLDVFRREDSGEVRGALLLPIKIIIKFCQRFGYSESLGQPELVESRADLLNPEAISLAAVYKYLLDDLKHNKKTSTKTVKAEIFKILGMLVGAFPSNDSTIIQVQTIVDYAFWSLDQNFSPTAKEVEPSVIAGIFSCLDRICYSYENIIFATPKMKATLFEYLLKAVSAVVQGDIARFAMSSKALRFLRHHAGLFQELIAKHAKQAYKCVFDCYKSGKEGVQKHADETLLNIASEISSWICNEVFRKSNSSTSNSVILKEIMATEAGQCFQYLLQTYLTYLNGAVDVDKLIAAETSFTAKAISSISPAIAQLERIGFKQADSTGSIAANIIQTAPAVVKANVMSNESSYYEIPASWSIKHVHLFYSVACLVNDTAATAQNADGVVAVPREIVDWLLETATDAMMGYNKLTKKYQLILTKALIYMSLCAHKSFLSEYLEVFVPALFLRTVSRGNIGTYNNYNTYSLPTADEQQTLDSNLDVDVDANVVLKPLVRDYVPLWKELFAPTDKGLLFQFMKRQIDYMHTVGEMLFNHFYVTMLKFIRMLNLEYSSSSDATGTPDSISPANPVDQDLAINIGVLVDCVVPHCFNEITLKWLPVLIPEFVDRSTQYPLVSTFYTMIGTLFRVVTQYSQTLAETPASDGTNATGSVVMDFDSYLEKLQNDDESSLIRARTFFDTDELRPVINRISEFIGVIKGKISGFNDELLSAALGLLLCTPRIIVNHIDEHIDAICVSLETGYQVETALMVFERYIVKQEDKRAALVSHLPRVLKLLEQYLVVADDSSSDSKKTVQFNTALAVKLRFMSSNNSNELMSIQRSVLRILGRLGGYNQLMIQPQQELLKSSLAWSANSNNVTVKFPLLGLVSQANSRYMQSQRLTQSTTTFGGGSTHTQTEIIEVKLSLDRLLPRIVEIASSQTASTDRYAKLAAAESLHSIMVFLIGSAATSPDRNKDKGDSDLVKIYSKLLPTVISLSVDSEIMCAKLFDKLLFQIVHWFAGANAVHEAESAILVDVLVELLCTSLDVHVRSQCSKALSEFFKWCVKQTSKKDLATSTSLTVDSLLSRLFVTALHSKPLYRAGATSVFRKIYVQFREETALVSKYSLLIVSTLLKSMQLGGSEEDFQDYQETLKAYSSIIIRSITARDDQAQLLSVNDHREGPLCLRDLVDWIWSHTANEDKRLRKVCMQLFVLFTPLLNPVGTKAASSANRAANHPYIDSFLGSHGLQGLVALALGTHGSNYHGFVRQSGMLLNDSSSLLQLIAALDFMCWLIKNKILNPKALFQEAAETSSKSKSSTSKSKSLVSSSSSAADFSALLAPLSDFITACHREQNADTFMQVEGRLALETDVEIQKLRAELLLCILYFIRNCMEFQPSDSDDVCQKLQQSNIWGDELRQLLVAMLLHPRLSNDLTANSQFTKSKHALFPAYDSDSTVNSFIPHAVVMTWKHFNALDQFIGASPNSFSTQLLNEFMTLCASFVSNAQSNISRNGDGSGGGVSAATHFCDICVLLHSSVANFEASAPLCLDCLRNTVYGLLDHISLNLRSNAGDPTTREFGEQVVKLACALGEPLCPPDVSTRINAKTARCLLKYILRPGMLAESFDRTVVDSLLSLDYVTIKSQTSRLVSEWSASALRILNLSNTSSSSSNGDTEIVDEAHSALEMFLLKVMTSLNEKLAVAQASSRNLALTQSQALTQAQGTGESLIPRDFAVTILNAVDVNVAHKLTSDLQLAFLELESHVPNSNRVALRNTLSDHALTTCVSTFQSPQSTKSDLIRCLHIVPHLVAGCSSVSPRPLVAGFKDEAASVQALVSALEEMVADKFPLNSKELDPYTAKGKEFIALLEAYLDTLVSSGAPCLLTPILPTLREGPAHRYYKLIISRFRALVATVMEGYNNSLASGGTSEGRVNTVNLLCGVCMAHIFDESQTLEVKQILMDYICFPLLRSCNSSQLASIVTANSADSSLLASGRDISKDVTVIKQLAQTVQMEIPARPSPADAETINAQVFLQACAFAIIEIVYDKCSPFTLKNDVTRAFAGQVTPATQKELTQSICRTAHKLIRSELNKEVILQTNRVRLYSTAFSCLAVIVAKTQSEEKFFNSLVFDSKPEQCVWDHIIDTSITYSLENKKFETVFVGCRLPGAESVLTTRRSQNRRAGLKHSQFASGLLGSSSVSASQFANVSNTQTLSRSRTRKQMSQLDSMDWSQDIQSSLAAFPQDTAAEESDVFDVRGNTQDGNEFEVVEGFDDQTIAIEMNELNTQTIMQSLVRIIQRMHTLFGEGWSANPQTLPKWLTVCKDLLIDGLSSGFGAGVGSDIKDNKRNIRLFMLRLFLNQPVSSIIAKYMQVLLPNILECCVNDLFPASNPQIQSMSMNYFLRDVVFALCNAWSATASPDLYSKALCWRLLAQLTHVIYDDDSTILKENLNAVTTLINKWVDSNVENGRAVAAVMDLSPLLQLLSTEMSHTGGAHGKATSRGSEALKKRRAALEIFKALIVCGIHAQYLLSAAGNKSTNAGGRSNNPLIGGLFHCLNYPRKELMEESAGVLGCMLNSLKYTDELHSGASSSSGQGVVVTVQALTSDLSSALLNKMTSTKGWDVVAACLKTISEHDSRFLDRDLFIRIHSWFKKMSVRAKYEYLSALYNSVCDGFGADVIEHMSTYLNSCLSDVSIVSLGRGTRMLRLPMIQINTLKLLKRFWRHIDASLMMQLLKSDILMACVDEGVCVQVRLEAFEFILEICSHHDTFALSQLTLQQIIDHAATNAANGITTAASNKTVEIQTHLVSLLLKGLCDTDCDGVDVDEVPNVEEHAAGSASSSPMPSSSSFPSSSVSSSLTQSYSSQSSGAASDRQERVVIRKRIYDYFVKTFGLSDNIVDRLHTLMTGLYEPQRSQNWLNYSSHLLLSLCNSARQYTTVMFERSLAASAQFTNLNLNALSSQSQHQGKSTASAGTTQLTPLFSLERKANSQLLSQADQSYLFGNSASQSAYSQVGAGFIRGTQEYSWTQTQDMNNSTSKHGTVSDLFPAATGGGGRRAELFVTQSVVSFGGRTQSQRVSGGTFTQTQSTRGPGIAFGASQQPKFTVVTQQLVPRRFKQVAGVRAKPSFAYYNLDVMSFKANQQQSKRKLLAYRRYRDGELPDIAISLSDIVKPLQLLCLRDTTIAGTMLSILFECSIQQLDIVGAASVTVQNMFECSVYQLRRIVSSGVRNASLVSVMLNNLLFMVRSQPTIAAELPLFRVQPAIVGEAALKSLNVHVGIALLEEQLLAASNQQNTGKVGSQSQTKQGGTKRKGKISQQLQTQDVDDDFGLFADSTPAATAGVAQKSTAADMDEIYFWHQLCRCYNSLGERDVFLNLSSSLSANTSSRKALEAELDGDFGTAVKIYSDLLEKCALTQRQKQLGINVEDAENEADSQEDVTMEPADMNAQLMDAMASTDKWLEANPIEVEMWNDRAVECMKQLCDWTGLETMLEKQRVLHDATSVGKDAINLNAIASSYSLRDRFLSPYVTCLALFEDTPHTEKLYTICQQILNTPTDATALENSSSNVTELIQLKGWLETRHSAELAIVYSKRKEWGRSRAYSNTTYAQFVLDWSGLHPCATQAKRNLLRSVQRTVEIEDLAVNRSMVLPGPSNASLTDITLTLTNTQTQPASSNTREDRQVLQLLSQWCASEPAPSDAAYHWDTIISQRYILKDHRDITSRETEKLIQVHLADLHRSASVAAISQGNLNAAKLQLEKSGKLKKAVFGRADHLSITDVFAVCNYNNRSISRKLKVAEEEHGNNNVDAVKELCGMFDRTLKLIDTKLRSGTTAQYDVLVEAAQAHVLKADWLSKYSTYKLNTPQTAVDPNEVSACHNMLNEATTHYTNAAVLARDLLNSDIRENAGRHQTLLDQFQSNMLGKFAKHHEFMLNLVEEAAANSGGGGTTKGKRGRDDNSSSSKTSNGQLTDVDSVAREVIATHIQGLQYGSNYCKTRLLRLLKVIGSYPNCVGDSLSADNIARIPAWQLVPFGPQLMGCLDLPEGPAAAQLLEHIASVFPTVLQYPYKITSEFLGNQGKRLSERLSQLLKNDSIDSFVEALTGLTHPELRWNDGVKAMTTIFKVLSASTATGKSQQSQPNPEVGRKLQEYYQALRATTIAADWRHVGARTGLYNKKWAKKVQPLADEAVGADGEKFLTNPKGALQLLIEKIKPHTDAKNMKFAGGKVPLNEFSSWLSEFDHTVHKIEIPGQYFNDDVISSMMPPINLNRRPGQSKALMYANTTESIVSVDPQLLVMSSIRKPKRIKFYGSFGKEHMFLVKGGEDLRNDERIQKLFMLMNSVVNTPETEFEPALGSRSTFIQSSAVNEDNTFKARTYSVIPMTSKVGLLEWVKDTMPLKSVISKEMAKDAVFAQRNNRALNDARDSIEISSTNAHNLRFNWVGSHGAAEYHAMFRDKDKDAALKIYADMKAELPDHFLRRYLLSMCTGAESYLTLRSEFAKTLASSSIFGYILGLGDRHLENLMLDVQTGGIVQIDFGICFGMGASLLPVPEFLPFRLSPQLLAVLKPLDGCALLKQYMAACLRKLRSEEGLSTLSNALEMYVNDPIVEWMKTPLMQREEMLQLNAEATTQASESGTITWEPRRRINNAIRKIKGFHPGAILLDDLSTNATVKNEKSFDALAVMIQDSCVNRLTQGLGALALKGFTPDGTGDGLGAAGGTQDGDAEGEDGARSRKKKKGDSASILAAASVVGASDPFAGSSASAAGAGAAGASASLGTAKSKRGTKAAKTDASSSSSATGGGSGSSQGRSGHQILVELAANPPLPVGEQIDMLMAMATDPQLMVRQWQGLAAWV